MSDDPSDLRDLQHRAAIAAPARPDADHLDVASLARIRKGDDDETLDAAYRHVASCAICRARLTDAEEGEALVEAAMPTMPASLALVVPDARRNPARRLGWWMAAAAMLALVLVLFARDRGHPGKDVPLIVTQRSFVGTMGTSASTAVAPQADRNVELTLETETEAAVVVVCDGASGRRVMSPLPFTRDARGKLVVVLAPRLFSSVGGDPSADANAWVLAGSEAALQRVLGALSGDTALVETHVRSLAVANDVRVSIVPIAR